MGHLEGQALGRYRLLHLIGHGGTGEVYLAQDEQHAEDHAPRQVAIKVVRISDTIFSTDSHALRLFREGRFVVELQHPHILPVYHDGIQDDLLFLVMPYMRDGSLDDAIQARLQLRLDLPTAFRRVSDYVSQLAEALQYTHDRHIVHRDVKPGNVLIEVRPDGQWHLFLTDFGIARTIDTTSQEQGWHGTVAYMAPEQFRSEVSPAVDQYALAVAAFQLLSGQLPFGMTPPAIRTLNPAILPSIEQVLLQALAVHPEERFNTVTEFATALQAADGTTEHTKPYSTNLPRRTPLDVPPTAAQTLPAAHADGTTQRAHKELQADSVTPWQNKLPAGAGVQQVEHLPYPLEAASQEHQEDLSAPTRFRWAGGRRYLVDSDIITPHDAITYQFMDFQHYVLRKVLGRNHLAPLEHPESILHVAEETMRWVTELALEFPDARVVGFDLAPLPDVTPILTPLGQVASHVSFIEGDAKTRLPFPNRTFDYVNMRLVYRTVPTVRWPEIMAELVRVVRPGGWIECLEEAEAPYDPGPVYAQGGAWMAELYRRRGMDPDPGPKMKNLLMGAGLQTVVEHVAVSFPDVRLKRERRLWQTQNVGVFERVYRDPIIEAGIATASEYDSFLAALREEFEAAQYANSDKVYIVYGQRRV